MAGDDASESERRRTVRRRRLGAVLCAAWVLPLAALDYFGFHPLWQAEHYTQDFRLRHGRAAALHPEMVFLAIDQPDYREILLPEEIAAEPLLGELTGWPWSRSVYAALIERLVLAGARVVALDLLLVSPGEGDARLSAVLDEHADRVVLGGYLAERDAQGAGIEQVVPPIVLPDPEEMSPARPEGRVGYINFFPDLDGVVRRANYRLEFAGLDVESFSSRILRRMGAGRLVPATDAGVRFRFAGPPRRNVPTVPFYQVFLPKTWSETFGGGSYFRDKVVVVGPLGEWAKDVIPTPYAGMMPGPEVHVAAVNAALQGAFFREVGGAVRLSLLVAAGLLGWAALAWTRHPVRVALASVAGAGVYTALAFWLQSSPGLILPLVSPLLALAGTQVIHLGYALYLERQAKRRIRDMFSRMVSPEVLRYMMADTARFQLVGTRADATIFFSDLEGFTAIAEDLPPEDLARVLNRYFTPMSTIILRHRGYIDKYEGDAIMADFGVPVWNEPGQPRSHAWRACWAALEQREKLQSLQVEFKRDYGVHIEMRIGICTGIVSAGNMGSEQKFQYTVMGDTVNQAARLEPANKLLGTRILIAESTYEPARDYIEARMVAALVAKGKSRPVRCYELLAKRGGLSPEMTRTCEHFAAAWRLHAQRRFEDAIAGFEKVLTLCPGDGPALAYLEICRTYLAHPPPEDWAGELLQVRAPAAPKGSS